CAIQLPAEISRGVQRDNGVIDFIGVVEVAGFIPDQRVDGACFSVSPCGHQNSLMGTFKLPSILHAPCHRSMESWNLAPRLPADTVSVLPGPGSGQGTCVIECAAPKSQVAHGEIGVMVSLNDMANRAPRAFQDGEVIDLGGKRVRHIDTPHVPHAWESRLLFEETTRTLY